MCVYFVCRFFAILNVRKHTKTHEYESLETKILKVETKSYISQCCLFLKVALQMSLVKLSFELFQHECNIWRQVFSAKFSHDTSILATKKTDSFSANYFRIYFTDLVL